MKDEKAAGIVSLLHQILSLVHFAEIELFYEDVLDWVFEIVEGKVWIQRIQEDFLVLRLLLSKNIDKFLENYLVSVILDVSYLPQFPSLIIVALLSQVLSGLKFQITQATQQSTLFSAYFFHFL